MCVLRFRCSKLRPTCKGVDASASSKDNKYGGMPSECKSISNAMFLRYSGSAASNH